MSTIDSRVVEMKFNNSQFMSGVKTTLDALGNLKRGLRLDGATKGLDDVNSAAKNVKLDHIASSVDSIKSRFSAMSVVAVTALATIANKAVAVGGQMVKSLTIDPLIDGLREYETNMNSIQTILSNTAKDNTTLDDVNGALANLNEYSDKTIYNFAEMARNIGTFTAAGVDLETATGSIKGIANLAAMSGSSSQQASTAMYQLSQAISTGSLKLMDWNSVVNAGMGGQLFQDALADTARQHGVAVDEMIEKNGSFRESLQEGWITGDILTETLNKLTGDLTNEQLKSMGYNEKEIAAIQKQAKMAVSAAQDVKTVTQLFGTIAETAGSGWSQSWQLILGDFGEAKELFTGANNVISGMIDASADARNKVLGDWKELGGRTAIIDSISNAFNALMAVIKPIKDAFSEIFPPMTGQRLYEMSVALRDFTEGLMIGGTTANNLKRTFAGLFAILGIGWEIVKAGVGFFFDLFGMVTEGSGGILEFTGNIGDFLVNLHKSIKEGEGLTRFFEGLVKVLEKPIALIKAFGGFLISAFTGFTTGGAEGALERMQERLEPLGALGRIISTVWGSVVKALRSAWEFFQPLASEASEFFTNLGTMIADALSNIDYNAMLDTLNTGLFAMLVLAIKKFLSGGINIDTGTGGLLDSIKDAFGGLNDTLSAMQANLKAGTLLKIAGAVGILTASVVALALIDSGKLTKALTAITIMFVQLGAAMAGFSKIGGFTSAAKLPFVAAGLILLAGAMNIMALAVKQMSGLDWGEMAKGLVGVTALIGGLILAAKGLQGSASGMIRAGAGLIAVALAIKILASAVEDFSELSWAEMAQGLAGVSAALVALAIFTKLVDAGKAGIAQSAGLILLAAALKILASVVKDFSEMEWLDLGKGLLGLAASLVIIGGAMKLMQGSIGGAAALLVVSGALLILQGVLTSFGGMSWEEIAKGLVTLAGSLVIIAAGMMAMSGALPGAAALIIVSAALSMLAPVLVTLGGMTWEEIGKGLLTLAGALAVLGVAGLVMTPVIPTLLGLGAAIMLLGVGVAAAGAGILAFSIGLTALSVAGGAAAVAIAAIVSVIIGLIPAALQALAQGIVLFAEVIASSAPTFIAAMTTLLLSLITAIDNVAPLIIETLKNLILDLLNALEEIIPEFFDTAVAFITALLEAIQEVAPEIIDTLTQLIMDLLNAVEELIPEFVDVAVEFIMSLLEAIQEIGPEIIETLGILISDLVDEITTRIPEFLEQGIQMIVAILNGIADNIDDVIEAGANIVISFLEGLGEQIPRVIEAAADLIIDFVNGLAEGIDNNAAEIREAGRNLARAIIDGITGGLASGVGKVVSKAKEVASNALNAAKDFLGISSPSKEFFKLGRWMDEGMAEGLAKYSNKVAYESETVGMEAIKAMAKTMKGMSDLVEQNKVNPVIKPTMDLSEIRRSTIAMNQMLRANAVVADVSYGQARDISIARNARAAAEASTPVSGVVPSISFQQNNYSPKALSAVEIYRQTKNQLSIAKEALKT